MRARLGLPLLLGLSLLLGRPAAGQTVMVAARVARLWALLYREFDTEFLPCLHGTVVADTLRVELAVPADVRPSRSTPNDVTSLEDCAATGASYVGDAHSHPHETAALNSQRFHIDPSADLCYLSKPDQDSFRADSAALVTVVVCGVGQFMVWTRADTLWRPGTRCRYDPELPTGCRAAGPAHKSAGPRYRWPDRHQLLMLADSAGIDRRATLAVAWEESAASLDPRLRGRGCWYTPPPRVGATYLPGRGVVFIDTIPARPHHEPNCEVGRFQIRPATARARCPGLNVFTYAGNTRCFARMFAADTRAGGVRFAIARHNDGRGGPAARPYVTRVLRTVSWLSAEGG